MLKEFCQKHALAETAVKTQFDAQHKKTTKPSLHRYNLFGARGMYSYTAIEILLCSSHLDCNTEALLTSQDMR